MRGPNRLSPVALVRRVAAFRQDNRGGVAIIFAMIASTLCLVVAGGVEMHRRNLAMAMIQKAADAAALAAKKVEAEALLTMPLAAAHTAGEAAGKAMFDSIIAENAKVFGGAPPTGIVSWLPDDSAKVTVKGKFVSLFPALMPASMQEVQTHATVNFGVPLPTEVALVLDNTASMFNRDGRPQTRFTQLRDAAKMFTHQLFNAAEQVGSNDWLRISVVPWATTVNVLSEAPRTADASGNQPVVPMPDYGSKKPVTTPINRAGRVSVNEALFQPVGWRGCISGQGESTSPSDAGGMNWTALNVPNNALEQTTIQQGRMKTETYQYCTYKQVNPHECPPPSTTSSSSSSTSSTTSTTSTTTTTTTSSGMQGFLDEPETGEARTRKTALFGDRFKDFTPVPTEKAATCYDWVVDKCEDRQRDVLTCDLPSKTYNSCQQNIAGGRRNVYMPNSATCADPVYGCILANTQTVKNVGPCVADPNEWKWTGAWCPWVPTTNWTKFDPTNGPNLNCPAPMLGLSGNRKQVIETIERMSPVSGGTHADVGLRWGFRTLSPTGGWDKFFGLSKPPSAFGGKDQKLMILITDGANEQAVDYPGYWGCKGHLNPGCSGSPDKDELDRRMQAWCTELKEKRDVDLFTIAVNFSNPAAVAQVEKCASPPKNGIKRFYRIDASELKNVLNIIASQVIRLRLTS